MPSLTKLRGSTQIYDGSITFSKLASGFLNSETWTISSDNSGKIGGLDNPINPNDAVNKAYVDGLVRPVVKSPDGFATTIGGDYPTDYKSSGEVREGDQFFITSITNGTTVGSKTVNAGDQLTALVDAPGQIDSNWIIIESNRDQATSDVKGIVEIATQTEADAGIDTIRVITPAILSNYIINQGINKGAGQGMVEDGTNNFNIVAGDNSLQVSIDSLNVKLGNTNGASSSLEVTASGLEVKPTLTGTRVFNGGSFNVDTGANNLTLKSGGTFTLDGGIDETVLTNHPSGSVNLAVSSVKYVKDSITALSGSFTTKIYGEKPTVTDGSANVVLANTPIPSSLRVYVNGIRQTISDNYTLASNTITFQINLELGIDPDIVVCDYEVAP